MNEPKSYAMKMARADEKDIEAVQKFWDKLNDWAELGVPIDSDSIATMVDTVEGSFNRVFWGYQTLHDNACDKSLDYLDYKPEIKAIDGLLAAAEKIAKWSDWINTGLTLGAGTLTQFAEEIVPELLAAIAAAKGEATPKPVYPCEMCGTDTGDAKNIHRALAQDGNTYQVCNHCASQTHRWQEVNA